MSNIGLFSLPSDLIDWIGKRSPSATLTDETAEQIRVEYKKGGVSWESLAKKFGTNKRTVGRIISGESYV